MQNILNFLLAGSWKKKEKKKKTFRSLNYFFQGRDTTAATLTFGIYHLFRQPTIVKKMREEIDQLGENVTFENHTAYKYTLAVVDEVCSIGWSLCLLSHC